VTLAAVVGLDLRAQQDLLDLEDPEDLWDLQDQRETLAPRAWKVLMLHPVLLAPQDPKVTLANPGSDFPASLAIKEIPVSGETQDDEERLVTRVTLLPTLTDLKVNQVI